MSKSKRSRNGTAWKRTPKTDVSEMNLSEHSGFLEKCQQQKLRWISSDLYWSLFRISVNTIAKARNSDFSRDFFSFAFPKSSQHIWILPHICKTLREVFCRFEFLIQLLISTIFPEILHSHVKWSQTFINHQKPSLLRKIKVSERHNFLFQSTCEWNISGK